MAGLGLDDQRLLETVISLRRDLHRHPELSGQEKRTAEKIAGFLHGLGLEVRTFDRHYGVLGLVHGRQPGPVVALRADMDALPVTEATGKDYSSLVPGVMHACGHDAHTAILLGAASLLANRRQELVGTVKLLFQPAEEANPVGGAKMMLEDGVLESPPVDVVFGLHVWPDLPCGHVGLRKGPMAAASDRINIKILGRGAHAAEPHKGIDAIAIAADVCQGLNQIKSRQVNPRDFATISIGKIAGGERYNIIASEVLLEGTVRTLSEGVRKDIPCQVEKMLAGITSAYGGSYKLDYQFGYPVLINDAAACEVVLGAARRVVGESAVHPDVELMLGADDFARFAEAVPGAYFLLGCRPAAGGFPLHSAQFDIDERALIIGAKVMYETAVSALLHYREVHEGKNPRTWQSA